MGLLVFQLQHVISEANESASSLNFYNLKTGACHVKVDLIFEQM
jgi:hypothetical protein